jgi:hypothetical protein
VRRVTGEHQLPALGLWPATEHILNSANNALTEECMQAHGFQYPSDALPDPPPPEDEAATVDMPRRRQAGYGIAAELDPTPAPADAVSSVDNYVNGLPVNRQDLFHRTLFGSDQDRTTIDLPDGSTVVVHAKGCEADSRRALAGDVTTWARLTYVPEQLGNRLAEKLTASAAYLAATDRWRSCMAARRFPYHTTEQAQDALRTRYRHSGPTPEAREAEVAVAIADGECELSAHLPSTVLAVRRGLAESLPVDDRRTLVELAAVRAAAVGRAHSVLGRTQ